MIAETLSHRIDLICKDLKNSESLDVTTLSEGEDSNLNRVFVKNTQNLAAKEKERLEHEFFGDGPLEELFLDPDVTEIMINQKDLIFFEKKGRIQRHDDCFLSEITFKNWLQRLSLETKSQFSIDSPYLDLSYKGFRVHSVFDYKQAQIKLTMRRMQKSPWTFAKLVEADWCTPEQAHFLKTLTVARKTLLVVGGTGSGKTSVTNACLQEIRQNERVVVLEDTAELHLPNSISVKLLTRMDPQKVLSPISLTDLVRQSLRMRPDRIVMGEVRGGEAKDLLLAFSTGHEGGISTMHANSAHEALLRLEMLVQMGAPFWSLPTIRKLIFLCIQYVVVTGKINGERKLCGVHRLAGVEDFGLLLETVTQSNLT